MNLVDFITISIDAFILLVITVGIRSHLQKLSSIEAKVSKTMSEQSIRILIDTRIAEKHSLLDYRLQALTAAVDKLTSRIEPGNHGKF